MIPGERAGGKPRRYSKKRGALIHSPTRGLPRWPFRPPRCRLRGCPFVNIMRSRRRAGHDGGKASMKQYLLAVHMIEGEPMPAEAEMQRSYQAVDKFNGELMAAGEWV